MQRFALLDGMYSSCRHPVSRSSSVRLSVHFAQRDSAGVRVRFIRLVCAVSSPVEEAVQLFVNGGGGDGGLSGVNACSI